MVFKNIRSFFAIRASLLLGLLFFSGMVQSAPNEAVDIRPKEVILHIDNMT